MVGVRVCVWVILWVAAATHGDGVTVSAPAPSLDCSSAFVELTDCLTFVENGSTVAKPAGKCCSGLKKVVKREVSCLCDVFKQGQALVSTSPRPSPFPLPVGCPLLPSPSATTLMLLVFLQQLLCHLLHLVLLLLVYRSSISITRQVKCCVAAPRSMFPPPGKHGSDTVAAPPVPGT
ncbi:unnamed protein product [Musa textilis]